jgi:hypothetical protein
VLKKRQEKESKLPTPRNSRWGVYNPSLFARVQEGAEAEEEDVVMSEVETKEGMPVEQKKSVRFKQSKEGRKGHLQRLDDSLKTSSRPRDIVNKILDQQLDGISVRWLMFKNAVWESDVQDDARKEGASEVHVSTTRVSHDREVLAQTCCWLSDDSDRYRWCGDASLARYRCRSQRDFARYGSRVVNAGQQEP